MKSKAVRTSCIESASVDCIETALKVHQKIIWSSLNLESPYVITLVLNAMAGNPHSLTAFLAFPIALGVYLSLALSCLLAWV